MKESMNFEIQQQKISNMNTKINQTEENEQSFRVLWGYNKRTNISVIGVLEGKEKGRWAKKKGYLKK